MSDWIQTAIEGKIDFEGQKFATKVIDVGLISSTVVAFLAGFATQSLRISFGVLGVATLALAVATIPPWPVYNKHPLPWLSVKSLTEEKKSQ